MESVMAWVQQFSKNNPAGLHTLCPEQFEIRIFILYQLKKKKIMMIKGTKAYENE